MPSTLPVSNSGRKQNIVGFSWQILVFSKGRSAESGVTYTIKLYTIIINYNSFKRVCCVLIIRGGGGEAGSVPGTLMDKENETSMQSGSLPLLIQNKEAWLSSLCLAGGISAEKVHQTNGHLVQSNKAISVYEWCGGEHTLLCILRISSCEYSVQASLFSSSLVYWDVSRCDLTTFWAKRSGNARRAFCSYTHNLKGIFFSLHPNLPLPTPICFHSIQNRSLNIQGFKEKCRCMILGATAV